MNTINYIWYSKVSIWKEFWKDSICFFKQLKSEYKEVIDIIILLTHIYIFLKNRDLFDSMLYFNFDWRFNKESFEWLENFFLEHKNSSYFSRLEDKDEIRKQVLKATRKYDHFLKNDIDKNVFLYFKYLYLTWIHFHPLKNIKQIWYKNELTKILKHPCFYYFSASHFPHLFLTKDEFLNSKFNFNKDIWIQFLEDKKWKKYFILEVHELYNFLTNMLEFFSLNINNINKNYWFYYLTLKEILFLKTYLNEIIKRRIYWNSIKNEIYFNEWKLKIYEKIEKILNWNTEDQEFYALFQKLINDKYLKKTNLLYNLYINWYDQFEKYLEIMKWKINNEWYQSYLDKLFEVNLKKYSNIDFQKKIINLWATD